MVALLVPGAAFGLGGCAKEPPEDSLLASLSKDIPPLDATGATCTGQFRFETAHAGTGRSECRGGEGVPYSATTASEVAAGLTCNYTLVYDDPRHGTGKVACSDGTTGTTGTLTFDRLRPHDGKAVATMSDGRVLAFTYITQ